MGGISSERCVPGEVGVGPLFFVELDQRAAIHHVSNHGVGLGVCAVDEMDTIWLKHRNILLDILMDGRV